ncbi:MAG: rhodanese-related sulfurtransferase [Verrucomicrobia bacterium]|nr:rhodanese-related sulfurtransferase [Verrucomicrobiota bacterium]
MKYRVIAYYCLKPLENPQEEIVRQKEFFQTRDMMGRIYISEQGINAQMSALDVHAEEYIAWMRSDPRFADIQFKLHEASEHAFPKATIKYRRQLVAIDCEVDLSKTGEHVPPKVWKKMIEERDENTIVIDVRNDYEWKIGHFDGADLPPFETFREFPGYAEQLKQARDPKTTRVMMYCTGGIRCEYYSALMKDEGFENVYQLDGGVIQYGLEEGSDQWHGKLFVFDDRLVVPLSEDSTTIGHCEHCGTSCDVYYNCANMDCNELFTCCLDCLRKFKGCCCCDCQSEGRVRPFHEDGNAKPFRKWNYEEKQAWKESRAQAAEQV